MNTIDAQKLRDRIRDDPGLRCLTEVTTILKKYCDEVIQSICTNSPLPRVTAPIRNHFSFLTWILNNLYFRGKKFQYDDPPSYVKMEALHYDLLLRGYPKYLNSLVSDGRFPPIVSASGDEIIDVVTVPKGKDDKVKNDKAGSSSKPAQTLPPNPVPTNALTSYSVTTVPIVSSDPVFSLPHNNAPLHSAPNLIPNIVLPPAPFGNITLPNSMTFPMLMPPSTSFPILSQNTAPIPAPIPVSLPLLKPVPTSLRDSSVVAPIALIPLKDDPTHIAKHLLSNSQRKAVSPCPLTSTSPSRTHVPTSAFENVQTSSSKLVPSPSIKNGATPRRTLPTRSLNNPPLLSPRTVITPSPKQSPTNSRVSPARSPIASVILKRRADSSHLTVFPTPKKANLGILQQLIANSPEPAQSVKSQDLGLSGQQQKTQTQITTLELSRPQSPIEPVYTNELSALVKDIVTKRLTRPPPIPTLALNGVPFNFDEPSTSQNIFGPAQFSPITPFLDFAQNRNSPSVSINFAKQISDILNGSSNNTKKDS